MDRFREMEAFVAVVDTGSFVKAADLLGSSKAAVSRLVQDLESRLGARLLHRTTRRLSLTEAGQLYLERSRQILEELEDADSAVGLTSAQAVGRLKVNAPLSFGVQHLAPLWGAFLATHPEVMLDVSLNDRVVDLVEEGFDLAVRITRMPDSSLVSRRLASTRILLCASPQYLAAHGAPRSLADLTDHQFIGYSYSPTGDTLELQGPTGLESVNLKPRFHANNGDTCRAAALDHQGIVFQPNFLVYQDLAAGRLVPILSQYQPRELGIYAVYPSRKHLSGKVRALVNFLATAFEQAPWEN
ncbi:LysR family transcriptional regulator [Azospira sp. I13]|uniref:LysR family transcriptional regulator n=1 Tax=Azospira sp. I13 TaxID=1765050 RepID=UPI000D4614AA|nr:LysR family transcriptional regulator [Azospira sp. I13]GBG01401.1 LysR family transcriptional regulator [Azospira sp. I13]